MLWLEKYRPQDIKGIVGNKKAIGTVVKYFLVWAKGKTEKNIMALLGPSGVGKTLTAHLTAKRFGYDLLELNASDYRKKDDIENIVEPAVFTYSPYGKKVILLDEIDGMIGSADRGGVASLLRVIPHSRIPIIVTANDLSHPRFRGILEKAYVVYFVPLTPEEMKPFLLHIAKSENVEVDMNVLEEITRLSGGDMRVAINMLQSYATGKAMSFYARFDDAPTLQMLFSVDKLERLPLGVNKWFLIQWIYENLPECFNDNEGLYQALEYLCNAEFMGNEYFMFYLNRILSMKEKVPSVLRFPRNVALMGATKARRQVEKDFALALSFFLHQGARGIIRDMFPFLRNAPKEFLKRIMSEVGLDFELRQKVVNYWVK